MDIEELLQDPRIWSARTSQIQWRGGVLATGIDPLDNALPGGGWPLGALTEVFLDHYGIGELKLLMPALAALSRQPTTDEALSGWIAWIAPPFVPYAPALASYGVDLSRVLLVHPNANAKDCLWATEQALRSGSCAAVLAWVDQADDTALRRLQLAAEEGGCWGIIFRPAQSVHQNSPAALRLKLSASAQGVDVQILKCRGGYPRIVAGIRLCPASVD